MRQIALTVMFIGFVLCNCKENNPMIFNAINEATQFIRILEGAIMFGN